MFKLLIERKKAELCRKLNEQSALGLSHGKNLINEILQLANAH